MPRVSQDGKTYTFRIRPGFHFNTGERVRAANFARAINRDLNPQMGSPAAAYLTDIVGARDVIAGKATRALGVRAHGEVLTIRLTRRAPDIVQRLGTTYLCSVPTNWPIRAGGLVTPSAGPYFVSPQHDPNTVVLEKNPYYHGKRPRGPTKIVWSFNQPFDSIPLQVERAQESNLPSRGLHDRTGFEDQLGHRAHAAPGERVDGATELRNCSASASTLTTSRAKWTSHGCAAPVSTDASSCETARMRASVGSVRLIGGNFGDTRRAPEPHGRVFGRRGRSQRQHRGARPSAFVPESQVNLVAVSTHGYDVLDGAERGQQRGQRVWPEIPERAVLLPPR